MPIQQKNILATIKKGETESIEFKRTFDRQAIETLAAFANSKGGRVLVGINDKGKIEGIKVGKETIQSKTSLWKRFRLLSTESTN